MGVGKHAAPWRAVGSLLAQGAFLLFRDYKFDIFALPEIRCE